MKSLSSLIVACLSVLPLAGCIFSKSPSVIRRSGQTELFYIEYAEDSPGDDGDSSSSEVASDQGLTGLLRPSQTWGAPERRSAFGRMGEAIRFSDDIVALQINSVFLQHVPETLSGSRDVVVFAEIWENGVSGYLSESLNSIVHVAKNQLIPGRLNFDGAVAYGPTSFKGHPLRVRLTVMVLQASGRDSVDGIASVLETVSSAASATSASTGLLSSAAIGTVRSILRNLPDVKAFDFEFTFASDEPEELSPTLLQGNGEPNAPPSSWQIKLDRGVTAEFSGIRRDGDRETTGQTGGTAPERRFSSLVSSGTFQYGGDVDLDGLRYALGQKYGYDDRRVEELDELKGRLESFDEAIFLREQPEEPGDPGLIASLLDISSQMWFPYLGLDAIERSLEGLTEDSFAESLQESPYGSADDVRQDLDTLRELLLDTGGGSPIAVHSDYAGKVRAAFAGIEQGSMLAAEPAGRVNWLRFGSFAIIETRPYDSTLVIQGRVDDLSATDWWEDYEVTGQWVRRRAPLPVDGNQSGGGVQGGLEKLKTNYVLFSILPRQLPQEVATLRRAARLSDEFLSSIRQGQSVEESADAFSESMLRFSDEFELQRIADSVGRRFPLPESFEREFTKATRRWIDSVTPAGDQPGDTDSGDGARRKRLEEIRDGLLFRWLFKLVAVSDSPTENPKR